MLWVCPFNSATNDRIAVALRRNSSERVSSVERRIAMSGLRSRPIRLAVGPRQWGALGGLVEQFATDQHAANLRSSRTDFIELGISPQTPGRIFVDIAVAAERLNGLAGHPCRPLGRIENRAGGILARRLAPVGRLGDRIHVGAAGIERR